MIAQLHSMKSLDCLAILSLQVRFARTENLVVPSPTRLDWSSLVRLARCRPPVFADIFSSDSFFESPRIANFTQNFKYRRHIDGPLTDASMHGLLTRQTFSKRSEYM